MKWKMEKENNQYVKMKQEDAFLEIFYTKRKFIKSKFHDNNYYFFTYSLEIYLNSFFFFFTYTC